MINQDQKRVLRTMLQSNGWVVFQELLKEYKRENFYEVTSKRKTEFDTIWYFAHKEGGKEHLQSFINYVDDEAHD